MKNKERLDPEDAKVIAQCMAAGFERTGAVKDALNRAGVRADQATFMALILIAFLDMRARSGGEMTEQGALFICSTLWRGIDAAVALRIEVTHE